MLLLVSVRRTRYTSCSPLLAIHPASPARRGTGDPTSATSTRLYGRIPDPVQYSPHAGFRRPGRADGGARGPVYGTRFRTVVRSPVPYRASDICSLSSVLYCSAMSPGGTALYSGVPLSSLRRQAAGRPTRISGPSDREGADPASCCRSRSWSCLGLVEAAADRLPPLKLRSRRRSGWRCLPPLNRFLAENWNSAGRCSRPAALGAVC